jgi:transketolase
MAHSALVAARALEAEGIGTIVLSVPTIKPIDTEAVVSAARRTSHVITIEEHTVMGGFGSAVAECLSEHYPVKMLRLGTQDVFGQSGTPDELMAHYGLSSVHIREAVQKILIHK